MVSKMTKPLIRRLPALLGLAGVLALWPSVAFAHPLGTFTISRYSAITVVPGEVRIGYAVQLAEVPSLQLFPGIDTNKDEQGSQAEMDAWAALYAPSIVPKLSLTVNGRPEAISIRRTRGALLPNTDDGFFTLRFDGVFTAPVSGHGTIAYTDTNGKGETGWYEITAVGDDGVTLSGSSVPTTSLSDGLRFYPPNLLVNQPQVTSMTTSFLGAGPAGAVPPPLPSPTPEPTVGPNGRPGGTDVGAFAGLLQKRGLPLLLLAGLIAAGLGAWHAMLPGHGKTLTAAYMAGSGSTARQAVAAGSAVALMHTASVLGLGLLVLSLEHTFRPERLYPWLGLASGLIALGLGVVLLISRLSGWAQLKRDDEAAARRRLPTRRVRGRARVRAHEHDHEHGHTHGRLQGHPLSPRSLMALALAGGILPAPSALLVLLGAIQAHRTVYGLALVLAFSAGSRWR